MIFQEHESQALNEWLVQELEHICDADPKVLADYVLALLKNDASTTLELQETCVESLAEFLGNGQTEPFIGRLFAALESKSYLNSQPPNDDDYEMSGQERERSHNRDEQDRYMDDDRDDRRRRSPPRHYNDDERRDRSRYQQDRDTRSYNRSERSGDRHHNDRDFDRRMDGRSGDRDHGNRRPDNRDYDRRPAGGRKKCYDFQDKGYCLRGNDCKYEHVSPSNNRRNADSSKSHGRRDQRGGFQSRIKAHGPQQVLVVDNIPPEFLDQNIITEYFAKFGNLVAVQVDGQGKSAQIEFSSHSEAKACHSSPDAIFGNRFVKIYWSSTESIKPQPQLSQEELRANLLRMAEKKREAELAVLEKQKQLNEIQKNRTALIAKQMEEQTKVMEKIRDPSLTVQERAMLMKGLETLQESIKSLMAAASSTPSATSTPYRPPSFRPTFRPAYRPPYQPHTSERQFAVDSKQVENYSVYETKLQAFKALEAKVQELGDNVDPQVVAQMAALKEELSSQQQQHQVPVKKGAHQLDLRPKAIVFTDVTMDLEERVRGLFSTFPGVESVAESQTGIVVRFSTRVVAEAAWKNARLDEFGPKAWL